MFKGIEHTAIASPDPAALAAWYRDTLGFVIRAVHGTNHFVGSADGSLLEIIEADRPGGPVTRTDPGLRHLAIAVDDFDAAHATLQSRGVSFLGEPFANDGNRLVFFTDRDGNILHLIQRARPLY